jgi:uncharacterized membrane protein
MRKLTALGRIFVAIAMIAFGIQHFVYLDLVTRVVPALPAWVPAHSALACVVGACLIVAGGAILAGTGARTAALLLGAGILASFVVLYVPMLVASPLDVGVWTGGGKALALAGASLIVAGSLRSEGPRSARPGATVASVLGRLVPFGKYFLAAFLVLGGALHFVYAEFVAGLVPSWIPGHLFWTYFAGVALIAGGIGMTIPWTTRLAASLSALMIFLWVLLLHIPRAAASPHDSNETTAVFEALAMCGAAAIVGMSDRRRDS